MGDAAVKRSLNIARIAARTALSEQRKGHELAVLLNLHIVQSYLLEAQYALDRLPPLRRRGHAKE